MRTAHGGRYGTAPRRSKSGDTQNMSAARSDGAGTAPALGRRGEAPKPVGKKVSKSTSGASQKSKPAAKTKASDEQMWNAEIEEWEKNLGPKWIDNSRNAQMLCDMQNKYGISTSREKDLTVNVWPSPSGQFCANSNRCT